MGVIFFVKSDEFQNDLFCSQSFFIGQAIEL